MAEVFAGFRAGRVGARDGAAPALLPTARPSGAARRRPPPAATATSRRRSRGRRGRPSRATARVPSAGRSPSAARSVRVSVRLCTAFARRRGASRSAISGQRGAASPSSPARRREHVHAQASREVRFVERHVAFAETMHALQALRPALCGPAAAAMGGAADLASRRSPPPSPRPWHSRRATPPRRRAYLGACVLALRTRVARGEWEFFECAARCAAGDALAYAPPAHLGGLGIGDLARGDTSVRGVLDRICRLREFGGDVLAEAAFGGDGSRAVDHTDVLGRRASAADCDTGRCDAAYFHAESPRADVGPALARVVAAAAARPTSASAIAAATASAPPRRDSRTFRGDAADEDQRELRLDADYGGDAEPALGRRAPRRRGRRRARRAGAAAAVEIRADAPGATQLARDSALAPTLASLGRLRRRHPAAALELAYAALSLHFIQFCAWALGALAAMRGPSGRPEYEHAYAELAADDAARLSAEFEHHRVSRDSARAAAAAFSSGAGGAHDAAEDFAAPPRRGPRRDALERLRDALQDPGAASHVADERHNDFSRVDLAGLDDARFQARAAERKSPELDAAIASAMAVRDKRAELKRRFAKS
ncbi:hypothetical protein JL722_3683 [Aureococcus anophagefferens]|nr:hypothetical protein JL722_3683 [Aureococcus anophagefferens]